MCVYGWTKNPLVEYYIVEGWGDWRPPGNDGERKGNVTLNGNTYEIAKTMRYNQPSLEGTSTFPQYWSIRTTSGSANNQVNNMKGTIDVSKHFDAWSQAGLDMSGTLYEVSLNIEGYRSNGSANVKSVNVTVDDPNPTGNQNNQQQNNDWNNWNQNNQQQNNDWNNWNQNNQQQNNDWNNWGQNNQQQNSWGNNSNNGQPVNAGGQKLCAISFDDGASAQSRQDPAYRIMDALIKNNMSATFFYVGDWIKTNDQVKFAYQNGMEVANHTNSHPHLGQMGSQQIRSEWEQCNSKLRSIIGADPSKLMRLPYLESNGTVQSALSDVPLISCAIDTQDWNNASKDQIVNTIKQAAQNGSLEGAIVLCHENYATTAAAMEEVLPWLAQNGYKNVSISEMARAKGKTLAGGQVHTRV